MYFFINAMQWSALLFTTIVESKQAKMHDLNYLLLHQSCRENSSKIQIHGKIEKRWKNPFMKLDKVERILKYFQIERERENSGNLSSQKNNYFETIVVCISQKERSKDYSIIKYSKIYFYSFSKPKT